MSHIALTYHIVISTYQRQYVISENHERELYKFIYDFASERGAFVRRIGGMPDHVHILCDIPATISVADFVKLVKSESSKFLKVNPHFPNWQKWSPKYGAFSVDVASRDVRRRYIMNQKNHHKQIGFAEEYRAFLSEAGFAIDTPILGDDEAM
ncbi:MAG: IS200/IS605 family transposase [Bacteroidales bacterium]|nr:IS200/IS605 family transposase [Bacteroidales bacterium]